jgi:hypothetical protein
MVCPRSLSGAHPARQRCDDRRYRSHWSHRSEERQQMLGFELTPEQRNLQESVARLCADFPDEYWRAVDAARGYPEQFVDALTAAGWLAVLIPPEYGGGGGTLVDAAIVLQTIAESGGDPTCAHAQLYTMGTVLRHGSPEQKSRILPRLADGSERLQAFGVTEPDAGSDTTNITTFAQRTDGGWVVNGSKVWTSRVQHSDYLLLLARTAPRGNSARKTDGISVFLIDLRDIAPGQLTVTPIVNMINHETNALFFDNMAIPANALVGEEGQGFRYILSGMACNSRSRRPTPISAQPACCAGRRRFSSTGVNSPASRRTPRNCWPAKPPGVPPTRRWTFLAAMGSRPSMGSSESSARPG